MSFMRNSLVRTGSMLYTQARIRLGGKWKPYNQIIDGLFLGMIPIKRANVLGSHFNDMDSKITASALKANPQRPLRLVVSVIEADELVGGGFHHINEMVGPKHWKTNKVEHHYLGIADQTANVNNQAVINTVIKMHKCIAEGGAVYVHCKAGRSRSAMVCAIYLAVFCNMPLNKAKELLKKQRTQVELHDHQLKKADEIIRLMRTQIQNGELKEVKEAPLKILESVAKETPPPVKTAPVPKPIKKTNHVAGFFAGLASMIVAPIAWFHGAYQIGKEVAEDHDSKAWGVVAGIAAFIAAPVAWIFGGVRIGQTAANTLPVKPTHNLNKTIIHIKSPLHSLIKCDADQKNPAPRSYDPDEVKKALEAKRNFTYFPPKPAPDNQLETKEQPTSTPKPK